MFREALSYPTRPPEGGRSIIVGGLLFIAVTVLVGLSGLDRPYAYLAVLALVPWLLVRGYYVRVVRTAIGREAPTPPRFDDLRRLFGDGARAVGIAVVYLSPGLVVLGPLASLRLLGSDIGAALEGIGVPGPAVTVAVPTAGILAVVALMYLIGALYVLPVAVGRFAHSGRTADAFAPRTVVDGAMTEDYATAWAVSVAFRVLLWPITFLLRIFLVGFFLEFVVSAGARYCYGRGVGRALGLEPVALPRPPTDPDEWASRPAVRRAGGPITGRRRPTRIDGRPAVRRLEGDPRPGTGRGPVEPDPSPRPGRGRPERE